jgi:hypothetical protein
MELPTEEQRRWRELAANLRHDWRLAAHAARFDTVVRWRHNIATARTGSAIPALTWMPALLGGCIGLSLVIAGMVANSAGLTTSGLAVCVTTAVLAGIALLAIGAAGYKTVSESDKRSSRQSGDPLG